jgi:hypothetical protein
MSISVSARASPSERNPAFSWSSVLQHRRTRTILITAGLGPCLKIALWRVVRTSGEFECLGPLELNLYERHRHIGAIHNIVLDTGWSVVGLASG